jgi:hypothetical protein
VLFFNYASSVPTNLHLSMSPVMHYFSLHQRACLHVRSLITEYGSFFRIEVRKVIGYRKTVSGIIDSGLFLQQKKLNIPLCCCFWDLLER